MINKIVTQTFVIFSLHYVFCFGGCNENIFNPNSTEETKWEEIALFKNADIRYITKDKEVLYVSAVYHSGAKDSSIIFMTTDGDVWDTLKTFKRDIGPITFNGDTLTVLETGRIWIYHKSFGWKIQYEVIFAAWLTRDMIYLNNELFVFENRYYAFSEKSIREISAVDIVSKFVKLWLNGKEIAYTMPYYTYLGSPLSFNGDKFVSTGNNTSPNENKIPNYPALYNYNDTLYAGFNTPTRIKKLVDGHWVNMTDTINNTLDAQRFNPPLSNTASTIFFYKNKMFVGTERLGVMEWTASGWTSISLGLPYQYIDQANIKIFSPIIFLESQNGTLFTGFGEPGFAPVHNGRGLYKFKIR